METTNRISYQVTENNGGGLSLWIFDDGKGNQFAHTSYEYHPESLMQDIKALYESDNDVTMWDGNDLLNEDLVRSARIKWDDEENCELYPSEEDMFDEDGNLIPPDIMDMYDDDETTQLIAEGDSKSLTLYPRAMGHAGNGAFKDLTDPFEDEDGDTTIEHQLEIGLPPIYDDGNMSLYKVDADSNSLYLLDNSAGASIIDASLREGQLSIAALNAGIDIRNIGLAYTDLELALEDAAKHWWGFNDDGQNLWDAK